MTLVKKTFLVFGLVFIIQLAIIALLMALGYRQSEVQWRQVRNSQAYSTARTLLTDSDTSETFDTYRGQLAIYDTNRQLIGANRSMGMHGNMGRSPMMQTKPVYVDGVLVGYYATGEESFSTDMANQTLLRTMIVVLVISLVLSLGIALVAAWYFSRKVSRPADEMARALRIMTQGDMDTPVVPTGSDELIQIGKSIESLRLRLLHERTVRSQWSQDIAHDLRTPVASVKAQLEGLIDGVLKPETSRFERTMREMERMETLINDLEVLMRLESPEAKAVLGIVDCQTLARELHERFEAQLLQIDSRLETNIECLRFSGDEALLTRALSNLIGNAIRYGETGASIGLRMVRDNNLIRISVHNWGRPIPQSEIPKLTERLYRGEFARSTQGSGLGLTIVERIARLHNGTLIIESSEEAGTTISMVLPETPSTVGDA